MSSRRDPDRSALAVFADELRAQRERAGLSRDELAARLNYSASLIREVGGAKVMHDQLGWLAQTARRPNVTVQVIPGTGAHPGLLGAFAVAELAGMPAIVYLETAYDGQTVEDPGVGAQMSLRFDALRTEALTGRASLSLIEKVTEERWTS